MKKPSKLSLSIHDVQFAKDFQYFIEIHYEGVKKKTDVSAIARNPVFIENTFFYDPPSNHTISGTVIFVASALLEQTEPMHSKGIIPTKAKILGECILDLTPFALQPTQIYNLPIRQQMKFIRVKDGKQISVGRFIVSLKMVPQQDVPVYIEELEQKKIQRNEIYTELPDYDEDLDFIWRAKIDIRQAINVPLIDNMNPQAYIEVGWTEYKNTLPEEKRLFSTSILNSCHPQWNQIFLMKNPPHIAGFKGFIMVSLKQRNTLQDIIRVYIPIESMLPFVPYNLKLREGKSTANPTYLYISATLQTPLKGKKQTMHDIIIADVVFDSVMAPFKQINLALVVGSEDQPKINFFQFGHSQDTIQRILEFDQSQQFTYFMSQTMKVPPIKSSKQFKAACIFTIPESFLASVISIYLVGKVSKGTYAVAGMVEGIQKDLVNLLIEKNKKRLFFTVRPHPNWKINKCQIQIASKQQTRFDTQLIYSVVPTKRKGEETASEKLMRDLNVTSNDSLVLHVTQNNEIIARVLRELDDKSQSLRQAASQISDLRSRVKLLQNQNSILRMNALQQQNQLVNLVQRQVDNMSLKDLKQKIVKISQLYKGQRVRNKEMQKSMKAIQSQVSNTLKLNSIISNQQNQLKILQQKVERAKKDNERINVYKETIKKQEKVITKLEKVMKDGMEQVRNARNTRLQLEELKKKARIPAQSRSTMAQKQQIQRLQTIIANLQRNQKKEMNLSNVSGTCAQNVYQLQFQLHQAQTRIQCLESELQQKCKSYARQIAMYKMKIAQKQAILDGFSQNQSYN